MTISFWTSVEERARAAAIVKGAGTIVWNGPVGVFEHEQFPAARKAIAQAIAESKAFSIAGGGDTVAAINKYGIADRILVHLHRGGAFLEFLEARNCRPSTYSNSGGGLISWILYFY